MECCFCVLYKFLFPFKPYSQPLGLAGGRVRIQAIRSHQRQQHACHGKVYHKGGVAGGDEGKRQRTTYYYTYIVKDIGCNLYRKACH